MRNCQKYLKENFSDEYELIANAPNPFPLGYEPCMDVSPLFSPDETSYIHTIIGVMRWMVELGRIDIAVEVIADFLFPGHAKAGASSKCTANYFLLED